MTDDVLVGAAEQRDADPMCTWADVHCLRQRTRIVAGLALIAIGLIVSGTVVIVIPVLGTFPWPPGAFDVCVFAPLAHRQFRGPKRRNELHQH